MRFDSVLGLVDSLLPYNTVGGDKGKEFFLVRDEYTQYVLWSWRKQMLELGYSSIEEEKKHIEIVKKHMIPWLEKQPKKIQQAYDFYMKQLDYKLDDLERMK